MKKIIVVALLISSIAHGKIFDIGKFNSKLAGNNIGKLADEVISSPYVKNVELKKVALKAPPLDVVTRVALSISNKGKFGDNLISKATEPTDVLRQYVKYGDSYLDTMQYFSKQSMNLSDRGIKNLKQKFPTMPKISYKRSEEFNNKMVQTLKYTGRKGWETSQELIKLAKKHPKSTTVTALMAWYVVDPEGFFEQKEKLISFVGSTLEEGVSDVTKFTLGALEGVVDGFISVAKEKMTFSNIIILFLLFFSFILWKLRSYLKRYFKIKLEKSKKQNNEGLL